MRVAVIQVMIMKVVTNTTEVAPMTAKIVKEIAMAGPIIVMSLNNVRRRNQEVSLIVTQALQRTHTTIEVQKTMAPTGTHSNALLTMSPLINRFIFILHLYTVSRTMLH